MYGLPEMDAETSLVNACRIANSNKLFEERLLGMGFCQIPHNLAGKSPLECLSSRQQELTGGV